MTLFVCLDNANGMRFNHRRQSRDAAVVRDICAMVGGGRLLLRPGSEVLFSAAPVRLTVCNAPLDAAQDGDCCFLETPPSVDGMSKIATLIVYRWNRDYPADVFFPSDAWQEFRLEHTTDFPGTSHDKITKEVYVR